MSAGWLYYHKYPPKRRCPKCGKRHYATRIGVASNGEDFWNIYCTKDKKIGKKIVKLLNLQPLRTNKKRYQTTGGDKTPIGICLAIKRIFDEEEVKP